MFTCCTGASSRSSQILRDRAIGLSAHAGGGVLVSALFRFVGADVTQGALRRRCRWRGARLRCTRGVTLPAGACAASASTAAATARSRAIHDDRTHALPEVDRRDDAEIGRLAECLRIRLFLRRESNRRATERLSASR